MHVQLGLFFAVLTAATVLWAEEPTAGGRAYEGLPEKPPFDVVKRRYDLEYYPCKECHKFKQNDPKKRDLSDAPHVVEFTHGQGKFWCMVCHDLDDRNHLRTLDGEKVKYDRSYLVCDQCHSDRAKDWYLGGHGKRVDTWSGEREVYNCTHCHDAHVPQIEPRKPEPPPQARTGFPPPRDSRPHGPEGWKKIIVSSEEEVESDG